jgi:dihydrofolate reductase
MKLTAAEFLTLDGVYQGPGGPDEDRRNGFDRGGWQAPIDDEAIGPYITSVYERMDAMLLGRTTFDIWNAYWPYHDAGDPVSHGINVVPKYVPSTTLRNPTWQNTHVIEDDVEAKVRELKAQPGRNLLLQGSGVLLRWLLERDLVDELHLMIYPVVLGKGLRLFPDEGQSHRLEVVDSTITATGIVIQTYRPSGRATFGTVGQ